MIDNNILLKLFVQVPSSVTNFDGASVSSSSSKLFFDEKDNLIWAKGQAYGITPTQATALTTLIGDDSSKSVRTIAQEVVNSIIDWQSADANDVINTLKEVLNWFNNLPEGDAGALSLVNAVGKPAELYTAEDETANPEHVAGTVKTAATGLYKLIEDSVAGKNVTADGATGELLVDATAANNKVEVSSTTKLQNAVIAAESSIQSISIAGTSLTVSGNANAKAAEITKANLQSALFTNTYTSSPLSYTDNGVTVNIKENNGELTYLNVDASILSNRVTALEEYDPWENYVAPTT